MILKVNGLERWLKLEMLELDEEVDDDFEIFVSGDARPKATLYTCSIKGNHRSKML